MGFLESVPRLSRVRIEEGLMLPNRCHAKPVPGYVFPVSWFSGNVSRAFRAIPP